MFYILNIMCTYWLCFVVTVSTYSDILFKLGIGLYCLVGEFIFIF